MFTEQRIRAFLFYLSVLIFLAGLPVILSSALGYKFNRSAFKFTKTGLVFLKTQPAGASIFLNNKLLTEETPATIRELMPGNYNIRLELKGNYPWEAKIRVEPNRAVLLDKIILFPMRPNVKNINKEPFDSFFIDEEKNTIYYVNYIDNGVYSSGLDGARAERTAGFAVINPEPSGWKLSADRQKLLYFNRRQIGIAFPGSENAGVLKTEPFIIEHPQAAVEDIFWHSDNYHLVVVCNRSIEVLEAEPNSSPVELVKLNKPGTRAFFDSREDALYFTDSQRAEDGKIYENLYKLELSTRFFPFAELLNQYKLKNNE